MVVLQNQTHNDEIELKINNQLWRHFSDLTEKCHPTNVTNFFHFGPLPIIISE